MKRKRIKRRVFKIFSAVLLILIGGFISFNIVIKKKISEQLTNLSPALRIEFASLHTNFFSSSVSVDRLQVDFTPYPGRPQNKHSLYFSRASIKEISFFKFLFNKKLAADNFQIEEGNIQIDQFLFDKRDSSQEGILKEMQWPFEKLFINNVGLKGIKLFLHKDGDDKLIAKGDITVGRMSINMPGDDPAFSSIDLHLSGINYPLAGYAIQISQLAMNSTKKMLEIDSLRVIAGKQKQNEAHISTIRISGFDVMKLLNDHILTAGKITIGESNFVISNREKLKTRTLPFNLKRIHADMIQFNTAFVSFQNKIDKCNFKAAFNIHNLNLNNPIAEDDVPFTSVQGSFSGIHYSGNSYNIEIKNIELNSVKEIIEVKNLRVIPRFGKYEFARRLGRQADLVEASIPKIEIVKPDVPLLAHQKLIAEKIKIGESRIYIFRDRRLPRQQKIMPLPAEYLKTLPLDIRVKTLEMASSSVAYEEYPEQGYGQTGILRVEKIKLILTPLINHPFQSDPAYITMNVEGSIMGSGTAHGTIVMPLQKNRPYHIKGIFERLELTKLNSSSENLGRIRIKSGFLDFLFFDFTMTQQRSTGKIIGAYHHLIIQQLKKHTDEKNVADFASFMLRQLIIPLNKDKSLPVRKRTGLVNYQRDPTRMVSHYFLQSLLMGVKKSFTLGFLLPK